MEEIKQTCSIKKVLIADDEEHIAALLAVILKKEGFDPVVAHDGQEAKEKFLSDSPDLVLLDLDMPRVNGWQFLQWLRQEKKLSTPVIIVSGRGQMNDLRKGYDLQADYYLVKPLNAKDIIKGIMVVSSLKKTGQQNDTEGKDET